MRKLLLLALLPTLAFGQVLVEGKAEATVSTSGTSAVSGALSLGWKFVQCNALTHYRLGSDTTATATTTDMTIPASMAWPVLITQDLRRIAFILDSSTGSCSIYPSNATAWNSMRYRWPSIDGTAITPASITTGAGTFSGLITANGGITTTTLTTTAGSGVANITMPSGGRFFIDGTRYISGGGSTFDFTGGIVNSTSGFTTANSVDATTSLLGNSIQTHSGGAQAMSIATTGTGVINQGNTTGGTNFAAGPLQYNGANLPKGPADVYFDAYDSISTVSTGAVQQGGATATAMTVQACNYTVLTAAVGTGTETMELCSSTGITTGNCTGTKYCTCSITSGNAARTVVSCTVNTAAIAAGVTPTWVETADTIATSDAIGNMSAHFTSP